MNECGECQACCVVLPIVEPELNKPAGEPCKFLCAHGCSIHNKPEQPGLCKRYRCGWRLDKWIGKRPQWRPDKLGVIIEDKGDRIVLSEVHPGALQSDQVKYILSRIAGRKTVKEIPVGAMWGHKFSQDDCHGGKVVMPPDYEWNSPANGHLVLSRKDDRIPLPMAC